MAGGVRASTAKLPKDVTTITLVVHLLRGRRQDAGRAARRPRGARRPRPERAHDEPSRRRPRRPRHGARARCCARCARSLWSFFGVRKAQRPRAGRERAQPGARDHRRRRRRRAVRRSRWSLLVNWVIGSGVASVTADRIRFRNWQEQHHMSAATHRRARSPTTSSRRRRATRRWRRSACCFIIFGASQWVNGARLGRVGRCSLGFVLWAFVLSAVVPRGDRRERRRPVQQAHRRLVPLEHELVHLLGGDVLRRLLRRAVLGPRCIALPTLGDLDNAILWPDFKAVWPSAAPGYTGSPAGIVEPFATMGPWPIPTINTALLLTSGVTLTIAHHALIANHRAQDDRLDVDHGAARHRPSSASRPTSTSTPTAT